jgi:hypothetical protein
MAAARDLGFRLPGQSHRNGHPDYAARPLTDSIMAAIHNAEPFVVAGLEDLPQTVTRRVALGLWRLAVAATLTGAETQGLWRSANPDLAVVLNEEEIAWHHPWRFEVAHHILTTFMAEDDAEEWMGMLEAQTDQFRTLVEHLQQRHPDAGWLQDGICSLSSHRGSVEGRGGTAVWRAERALEMTRIESWLTNSSAPPKLELAAPGWTLRWPEEWTKVCLAHDEPVPNVLAAHAEAGKVCVSVSGSRRAYWPLAVDGKPVEQFSACLEAGRDLPVARIAEVVLLDHDDLMTPGLPAALAHNLDLITKPQRDDLVAKAAARNFAMMTATLERADARLDATELAELRAATGDPRKFVRLANRHHLACWFTNDWWRWHIGSVVEGIRQGHTQARIGALTGAFIDITAHHLEMSMNEAWRRAFWLGRADPDEV